ncbi:formyltetrahydrofolate deformylase [Sporosarcina pasteurii]|uniref:Formyltetrahydrofolate deformylase n=1 Tax=Sporosarcina pasteurii TaxID=1474 RepID=A0A380C3F0_SPOPA|nr:formyltetrahydrofolate deformylase [Sporosarcina pasteurii]MDS9471681.1 formyltetrahydrofolate deformylase [Sporosarcina pasteurii]QBQ04718.1 formyltetrahydrofolate deformylase [Sporosarcina pasteurii]SUJ11983.1 Formyltetrahydrofolate deformylase [Sporosarcina pasteurii]
MLNREIDHIKFRQKRRNENQGRLLVSCPDKPGIVSVLSTFLYQQGANIIESSQYTSDPENGMFFIRIEFVCEDLVTKSARLEKDFEEIAKIHGMGFRLAYGSERKRSAIYVSRETHCLMELLWEWQSGDLDTDIVVVISNHEEARPMVEALGIPFHYIPANKDIRQQVEAEQIQLMEKYDVDLLILARYMQILTPNFVSRFANRIINIHHSFLPAFIGAGPYERAYDRGVKLIGATSHYVTNDLDEGPIIEQDVVRVDHRDHVADLKKIGSQVERSVLVKAVKWHLEDRIIVQDNKTIVFH